MGVFKDLKNLVIGMKITGRHLGRHAVTIQYPEEKMEMPERSRGIVVLLSDKETGALNCTSCLLCMKACPTAAIRIDSPRGEDKKRHLQSFDIDFGICCFCGLCEEACNFCAIKMAPKYEFSSLTQGELVWDMKKLQEMGRDVDYVDTRKKKPAKKAAPAAKPDEKKPATDTKPADGEATAPKAEAEPKKDEPGQEESNG